MRSFLQRFAANLWRNTGAGWRLARILLLFCVGVAAAIMMFEHRFIFYPAQYPAGRWDVASWRGGAEGEITPQIEDCWLTAQDGTRLHGWLTTPQRMEGGAPVPLHTETVILYFHGNAGNISHRYPMLVQFSRLPARVFIIDYRGYGRSEGRPSESGLRQDARAAWNYLTEERGFRPKQIVIFGKSLGGAVAIELASEISPAGLIVQSGFTSIPDMAAEHFPFIPRFLVRTRMDALARIPHVRCPILFIYSPADEIIPYAHGQRLFAAATAPKQFHEVAGAAHNELDARGGRAYFAAIQNFVRSVGQA